MSIIFQWDKLDKWPRKETPASSRRDSPFKSPSRTVGGKYNPATKAMDGQVAIKAKSIGVGRTYEELESEIGKIGNATVGAAVHIRTQIGAKHFARSTGFPVADAPPPDFPGVVVEITVPGGKLIYACDKFNRWQDNLRAIALTLQRLRLASIYGVLDQGEQYIGSRALPPPGASLLTPVMSVEAAAAFIAKVNAAGETPDPNVAEVIVRSPDNYRGAYRAAAAKLHPDNNDQRVGQDWHTLLAAKSVLDAHHGRK